MNGASGVILNNHNQVAFVDRYSLFLSLPDNIREYSGRNRRLLVDYERDGEYLTVCPNDKYLAYWSYREKAFRIIDVKGSDVWSCPVDKNNAWSEGCFFSSSGDAFICRFGFNSQFGLFLFDIETRKSTFFGCSSSNIGTDAGLNYFVLDSCNSYEGENMVVYETDPASGEKIIVTSDVLAEKFRQGPLVIDRQGCIITEVKIPVRNWQGLALREDLSGFVVLKDNCLSWYSTRSDDPAYTIPNCVSNRVIDWYFADLFLDKDQVLIQCGKYAVVANHRFGVIWKGYDLLSVYLKDTRILAIHENEDVDVILCDGTLETSVEPIPGFRVLSADIYENNLLIAYLSQLTGDVSFQTYELAKLSLSGQSSEHDEIMNLTQAFENLDPGIREQTAIKLGDLGSSRALLPLIRALRDREISVRYQAVTALSRICDIRAVHYITKTYLGDRDPDLERFIPVIDSRNNSYSENQFLAQAIKQFDKPVAEIMIDIVNNRGGADCYYPAGNKISWDVALLVIWSLRDDSSRKTVDGLIGHPKNFVRYRFAHFLGTQSEEKATEFLFILLGDESELVREAAVASLGKKRGHKIKEALIQALFDRDAQVRKAAEESLRAFDET